MLPIRTWHWARYVFNIESDPTYPDNGSMLTDGVRANAAYYRNAAYFGHLRQDYRIVVIDLEAVYKIDKVLCHFLNQQDVGIDVLRSSDFPRPKTVEDGDL